MYTIGDLCKRYKLSRSTILYYDKLGLLKPSSREDNNYRIYDETQMNRLDDIVRYRASGITLKEIAEILDSPSTDTSKILMERLKGIQYEIRELKKQESLIVDVLKKEVIHNKEVTFSRQSWSKLLQELGHSQESALKWHRDFENDNSKMHRAFLRSLNISDDEIEELRDKL